LLCRPKTSGELVIIGNILSLIHHSQVVVSTQDSRRIHRCNAPLSPNHFSPEISMHHKLNNITCNAVLASNLFVGVPDTLSVGLFFPPQNDILFRGSMLLFEIIFSKPLIRN
jgi:hypothetical protein